MRIAVAARSLVEHPGSGGMERVTESLVREWAKVGHQVTVFTTPLDGSATVLRDSASVVEVPGTPGRYTHAWGRLLAERTREGFDVVMGVSAAARTLAATTDRPPVVMQAHGTSLDELRTKARIRTPRALATAPRNALWLARDLRDYRRYDAVVGVGPSVTHTIMDSYPASTRPRRYVEIPNGVPAASEPPINERPEHRAVFVGRVHPEKGVELAIRALADSRATLTICGDGSGLAAARALAHEMGVGDRVLFLGRVDEAKVRAQMRAATAVLVPSLRREGDPLVVLESLMEGAPALVSPQVAASLGQELPYGTVAIDLASSPLDRALNHARTMDSVEIARRAAGTFSLEAAARAYLELFASLAHENRGERS